MVVLRLVSWFCAGLIADLWGFVVVRAPVRALRAPNVRKRGGASGARAGFRVDIGRSAPIPLSVALPQCFPHVSWVFPMCFLNVSSSFLSVSSVFPGVSRVFLRGSWVFPVCFPVFHGFVMVPWFHGFVVVPWWFYAGFMAV